MEGYGIKYILTFESNLYSNNFRIELLEKDFEGDATVKKLGASPTLVQGSTDSGVCGTSLNFSIQADVDNELESLYTTDSKKYYIREYMNDSLIWSGYLLPELYSENYIAAPYDISVTASDQLATLKTVEYVTSGRKTLLSVVDTCLQATGMSLGYEVISSLMQEGYSGNGTFLDNVTINDKCYTGLYCYDVICAIMSTINATITQRGNRWVIARKNEINAPSVLYTSALVRESSSAAVAAQIGQHSVDSIFPIDYLTSTKEPAKKGAYCSYTYATAQSLLLNPNTESDSDWVYNDVYVQAPYLTSAYSRDEEDAGIRTKINSYLITRGSVAASAGYNLSQVLAVDETDEYYNLNVSYRAFVKYYGHNDYTSNVSLKIRLKLSNSESTYYLSDAGWVEDEAYLEATGEAGKYYTANLADKDSFDSVSLDFPGFPISGNLEVAFANNSECSFMSTGDAYMVMAISYVYLTIVTPGGYESNIVTNDNASTNNSDIELSFGDAAHIANDWLYTFNTLADSDGYVDKWVIGEQDADTFYLSMLRDHANTFGLVRRKFNGVIAGEDLIHNLYVEKFSSCICRAQSYTWTQLSDELQVELIEISTSYAVLDDFEITTTEETNVITDSNLTEVAISHAHTNKDVLDGLGVGENGELTYNNKSIANNDHDHTGDTLNPDEVNAVGDITAGGNIISNGEVSAVNSASTGSAGTSDYSQLDNKPQIAGVVLSGNKTLADLGIQPAGDYLSALSKSMVEAVLVGVITSHTHNYAAVDHNHTGVYAAANHDHAGVYVAVEDLNNYYNKTTADARFAAINGSAAQDFAANNLTAAGNIISNGEVSAVNSASTGSAGTSDYLQLDNKPQIAGVVLSGNKTLADLGIQPAGDYLSALSKSMVETVLVGEISSHSHARPSYSYTEITDKPTYYSANTLAITDNRGEDRAPNYYSWETLSTLFNSSINGNWLSGITVRGWSNGYSTWQLLGNSSTSQSTEQGLYYRQSSSDTTWHPLRRLWSDGDFAISDYLTTASVVSTYLPLSGGTLTGALVGTSITADSLTVNSGALYWVSTTPFVYDSTNGTRYYWVKMGTITSDALIEYYAQGDANYPRGTIGYIQVRKYNTSSWCVEHHLEIGTRTQPQIVVTEDHGLWIKFNGYSWTSFIKWRVKDGTFELNKTFTTGSTRYETTMGVDCSEELQVGVGYRFTQGSIVVANTYDSIFYTNYINAQNLTLAGSISGVTTITTSGNITTGGQIILSGTSSPYIYTNTSTVLTVGILGSSKIALTSSELYPIYNNNLITLGTSSYRWSTVYATALNLNGAISGATTISASGLITGTSFMVNNITGTGTGLSLYYNYTGSGMPDYGIAFAGTATFGTHGYISGTWATYLTTTSNYGWIFRDVSTASNTASISATGSMYLNGAITAASATISGNITCADITASAFVNTYGAKIDTYLFFKQSSATYGIYVSPQTSGNLHINGHNNYSYSKSIGVIDYTSSSLSINGAISGYSLIVPYTGSSWITMATSANQLRGAISNSVSFAHSLYKVTSSSGNVLAYGGLGDSVGFYGFYASRISANTSGTDFSTYWNTSDGKLTHTADMQINGNLIVLGEVSATA